MDATSNLHLPYIMPSQAQKQVTHNEALKALDALVMLSVVSRTLTSPPALPVEGDRYVVAAGSTGAWAGKDGSVAAFQDSDWSLLAPQEGWLAWCAAESTMLVFSAGVWQTLAGEGQVAMLGVNATPDSTNRLAVASDATLLSHNGTSHRLMLNKHADADTASLLFQRDFSGRAEIGLAGDNRLSFKVSPDGTSFIEALSFDGTTGKPSFPTANLLQDYAVNLFQDSGRFAGVGQAGVTVGAFAFPSYLLPYNGSTVAALGKFGTDNSDYGGAGASLNPAVKDLVDKIRDPSCRRYGVEFWVAQVTMGSGTSIGALTVGAASGHQSLYSSNQLRPPKLTLHFYLRALDAAVLVLAQTGQTTLKDGVLQAGSFAIAPSDGWVSITRHDAVDPYLSIGYQPNLIQIYAQAVGNRYLIACPALMGGIVNLDDNIGIVAGFNSWAT